MKLLDYIIPKAFGLQPQQPVQPEFDASRLGPKQVYLTWEAAGRPVKKFQSDKITRSLAIIGVIVALFLVIVQEYFLILVVVSLIFVSQVLSKTPPESVRYELNSYGVQIDDQIHYWHELRRFFFFDNEGHTSLAVDLISGVPSRLFLTIRSEDRDKIKEVMLERLQFLETVPESFLDRTYKSVTSKFSA